MVAVVDNLIYAARASGSYPDTNARPHQLIFGGDQIYADDVALALAETLLETGKNLMAYRRVSPTLFDWTPGFLETLPTGSAVNFTMDSPEVAPGPERERFIKQYSGYTTTERAGHLMFLFGVLCHVT